MDSAFEINDLFNSAADSQIGFTWPSFNFPFFDFPVNDVINGDDGDNDLQISGSGNIINGGNGITHSVVGSLAAIMSSMEMMATISLRVQG